MAKGPGGTGLHEPAAGAEGGRDKRNWRRGLAGGRHPPHQERGLGGHTPVEEKIPEIENFFGYGLQKRLIFLCYKRLSDFRESNVGYDSGNESSNIGGVTRIIDNKVFIYYEGDEQSLNKQITAGITQVLINDMLYSGSYSSMFTNSTFL